MKKPRDKVKVNTANLSISAKVSRIKKREIDKFIYAMVTREGNMTPFGWEWDISCIVDVNYKNKIQKIEEPEIVLDFSGILVQDIDSMTLRVNGEIQKDFVKQIKFHTNLEIYHQNNYSSEYSMIEVSEDRINYELEINEKYDSKKIGCGISRNLIAENVLVCWMNLTYNNDYICQTRPVETKLINSYVVNPIGERVLLERNF